MPHPYEFFEIADSECVTQRAKARTDMDDVLLTGNILSMHSLGSLCFKSKRGHLEKGFTHILALASKVVLFVCWTYLRKRDTPQNNILRMVLFVHRGWLDQRLLI